MIKILPLLIDVHAGQQVAEELFCLVLVRRFQLLLFPTSDSDGTTDVTRTMHFGTPNAFEKVHL